MGAARLVLPPTGPSVFGPEGPILFARGGTIFRLDPDAGAQVGLGPGTRPFWSPDRSRIAFVLHGGLWIMAADGSERRGLGDLHMVGTTAWSPDGRQILVDDYTAGTSRFLIVPIDGAPARELGWSPYKDSGNGSWSPGGSRVALVSGNRLLIIDLGPATGVLSRSIEDGPAPWLVRWSPDGDTIAYGATDGIRLVQADGSRACVLVDRVSPCTLDWSPDGRSLAYSTPIPGCGSALGNDSGAHVVDATSGASKGIFMPTDGGQVVGVIWSPDGRLTGAGLADIWIVNADGSPPRKLAEATDCAWSTHPDW